jgi:hypothetical protein
VLLIVGGVLPAEEEETPYVRFGVAPLEGGGVLTASGTF